MYVRLNDDCRLIKLRNSKSKMKSTGVWLYWFTFLQNSFMLLVIGGISSNEFPWEPGKDNNWSAENRLYRMLFGIIDITSGFFMMYPFYQILQIQREGHSHIISDPFLPIKPRLRVLRNLFFLVLTLGYFGASAYMWYLYQSTNIAYDTFRFIIYIAVIAYSSVFPLIVVVCSIRYRKLEFVNSRFKLAYWLLKLNLTIWMIWRLYRGIHGMFEYNLIFDMLSENNDWKMAYKGVLFFVSTLFPYWLLVSKLVYPSFFLNYDDSSYSKTLIQD